MTCFSSRTVTMVTSIQAAYQLKKVVVGDFPFCGLANIRFGFLVFELKSRGFSELVSCTVCGFFSNLVFDFRFLSTIRAVFWNSVLSDIFYDFSGLAKEVTSCSRIKTVSLRVLLYRLLQDFLLEESITSLVFLFSPLHPPSPLDRILVHRRVTLSIKLAAIHLCT